MFAIDASVILFLSFVCFGFAAADSNQPFDKQPSEVAFSSIVNIQTGSGAIFCSGVLIKHDLVLTSANCIFEKRPSEFVVNTVHGFREVSKFEIHSQFNDETLTYNLALLKVESHMACSIGVLDTSTIPEVSAQVQMVSWGHDFNLETNPVAVRGHSLEIVSPSICSENLPEDSKSDEVCTTSSLSVPVDGTCRGEAGAPLLSSRGVIGIASRADSHCRKFGLFTPIAAHKAWVLEAIDRLSTEQTVAQRANRCICTDDPNVDIGRSCSKWLDAELFWCYTDHGDCDGAVASVRFPDKYFVRCRPSLADPEMENEQQVNTSLPSTENFDEPDFIGIESQVRKNRDRLLNKYISYGSLAIGIACLLLSIYIVHKRRKREENERKAADAFLSHLVFPQGPEVPTAQLYVGTTQN